MKKILSSILISWLISHLHAAEVSGTTLTISPPDKTSTKRSRLSADLYVLTWDGSAGNTFLLLSPAPDTEQTKTPKSLATEWTKKLNKQFKNSLPASYEVTKINQLERKFNALKGYELTQTITTDKKKKFIHSFIFHFQR